VGGEEIYTLHKLASPFSISSRKEARANLAIYILNEKIIRKKKERKKKKKE